MIAKDTSNSRGVLTEIGQVREYWKCSQSCYYFITKYVNIPSVDENGDWTKMPFNLYGFQLGVLKEVLFTKEHNIIRKPRQMGITTELCAILLWLAIFKGEQNLLLVSIKNTLAVGAMRTIKYMYRYLPPFLQRKIVNGTSANVGTTHQLIFDNNSIITVAAATEDVGRSSALSMVVCDEFAFWRYDETIWTALQPTLSSGGKAILSSTVFGMNNEYYKIWRGATISNNGFNAVNLIWSDHPKRSNDWYKKQLRELGIKRVAQEVDCEFLTSGYNVFDLGIIKEIEYRCRETKATLYAGGAIRQYREFILDNRRYFLGADIASGRSRDFSAFSVMDEFGNEYVCGKLKLTMTPFMKVIADWGRKCGAVIAVETNAIGEGAVPILQSLGYPEDLLYKDPKSLIREEYEYNLDYSSTTGFYTNTKTRSLILVELSEDLELGAINLINPFFSEEAYNFVYGIDNIPRARGKKSNKAADDEVSEGVYFTDDSTMALAITNHVRRVMSQRFVYLGDTIAA